MTTVSTTWTEETFRVAGAEMQIKKAGSGEPLLILHGEMGQPGWLRYHEELARNYTVYAPSHPGFGVTARVDWTMNMRDLAAWYLRASEELGLDNPNVVGFSWEVGWPPRCRPRLRTIFGSWCWLALLAFSSRGRNSGHVPHGGQRLHYGRLP